MSVRLLCVGDIHLGRRPSRLGAVVRERTSADDLTPAAAWRRAVELAVAERVDAVLLAGDVVDQADDFFEAYRALESGVANLAEAGVAVIGVAGNHDVEVLPRLAGAVPAFRLLGAGGSWERTDVAGREGGRVSVLGWSFPSAEVPESPLDHGAGPGRAGAGGAQATVGLLHCDLDRRQSRHAPVARRALEAVGLDAWLLGHIHRPGSLQDPPHIGYLGSLTGLDPTETGARGPWLLEVGGPGGLALRQIPLAPLRFETLDISLSGDESPADADRLVVEALEALGRRLSPGPARPRAVSCRVTLSGRAPRRAELVRHFAELDDVWVEREGVIVFVERLHIRTRPAIALEELARGSDPAGMLARKVLLLRDPDAPGRAALVAAARDRLKQVPKAPQYRRLDPHLPSFDEVAALLEAASLEALDALLAQRMPAGDEARGPPPDDRADRGAT